MISDFITFPILSPAALMSLKVKWRLIHALKDVALPSAPYKGAHAASKEGSTELRPR